VRRQTPTFNSLRNLSLINFNFVMHINRPASAVGSRHAVALLGDGRALTFLVRSPRQLPATRSLRPCSFVETTNLSGELVESAIPRMSEARLTRFRVVIASSWRTRRLARPASAIQMRRAIRSISVADTRVERERSVAASGSDAEWTREDLKRMFARGTANREAARQPRTHSKDRRFFEGGSSMGINALGRHRGGLAVPDANYGSEGVISPTRRSVDCEL